MGTPNTKTTIKRVVADCMEAMKEKPRTYPETISTLLNGETMNFSRVP